MGPCPIRLYVVVETLPKDSVRAGGEISRYSFLGIFFSEEYFCRTPRIISQARATIALLDSELVL